MTLMSIAGADKRNERDREQRPADRAEVVHRAFEPVRATVGLRRHDVSEECVSRRDAQPA